jgi:hypothetical protein
MGECAESGESAEGEEGKATASLQKSFQPNGNAGEPTVLARGIVLSRLKIGVKESLKAKSKASSELVSATN